MRGWCSPSTAMHDLAMQAVRGDHLDSEQGLIAVPEHPASHEANAWRMKQKKGGTRPFGRIAPFVVWSASSSDSLQVRREAAQYASEETTSLWFREQMDWKTFRLIVSLMKRTL